MKRMASTSMSNTPPMHSDFVRNNLWEQESTSIGRQNKHNFKTLTHREET